MDAVAVWDEVQENICWREGCRAEDLARCLAKYLACTLTSCLTKQLTRCSARGPPWAGKGSGWRRGGAGGSRWDPQSSNNLSQKSCSFILIISLRNPQFYTNNLSQSKGRGGSRKSKSRRCSCKGRWRGRENPVVQSDAFHIWKILMRTGGEGEKEGKGELPQNLYKLRCSSSRVWFNWQTRTLTKMANWPRLSFHFKRAG